MIQSLSFAVVAASGLFFLVLGGACLATPPRARRLLLGFARTPARHYAELAVRGIVGAAFILSAPLMSASAAASLFGWLLLATTAGLLLMPWRWHRGFAERAVPQALRWLPLLGLGSMALGSLVLMGVWRGGG